MALFTIVDRELRVAAKSRRQSAIRFIISGLTVLGGMYALMLASELASRTGAGAMIFYFFSTVFAFIAWCSGVYLTSDTISREKREGTLGLLFLTDLKGVDVVLGKLASSATVAFYTILSAVPVLSMSFVLGGVNAGEVVRAAVALTAILMLSLSSGMVVSVFSRDARTSGVLTLVWLSVLTAVPLICGFLWPPLQLTSPIGLWLHLGRGPALNYYAGAGTMLAIAAVQLGIAAGSVSQVWQQRVQRQSWVHRRRGAGLRASRGFPGDDPVEWLAGGRGRGHIWKAAVLLILVALVYFIWPSEVSVMLPPISAHVLPYALALAVASRATVFFLGLRQQGAVEMLLCTPLTDREIEVGQWRLLRHRYIPYAVVVILLVWLPTPDWNVYPDARSFQQLTFASSGVEHLFVRLYITLRCVFLWIGAAWAGMYFALHSRRLMFVRLKAFAVGVLLPWFFFCIPEVMVTIVVVAICQSGVRDHIRATFLEHALMNRPRS